MGIEFGKINETLSFAKLTLICFSKQGLGQSDVLLKLDTRSTGFMDYKVILQKPEDREETNKTQYMCVFNTVPTWKKMLKRLKI